MKNCLVSIIIPVYNVEMYLEECLNSVINQTYANLEIILIDDGSTDKSWEICDEFAKKDNRIKVIHQKNAGVSSARNKGLDSLSGEFVTFIDSDDTIEKEHIENMVNLLEDDIDIVCMPFVQVENLTHKEFDAIMAFKHIIDEFYNKKNTFGWTNCNKLFKTSIIKNIRYLPDEKVGEDLSFSWKAFLKSKKVAFGDKKTYNYRASNTSVMQSKFDERHQTLLLVCDRFIEYVKKNNVDLLQEAYFIKAISMLDLIYYARKDKNIKFVQKYSNELQKIQMQIYKNKNLDFRFKFICFLHSNFYLLLYARYKFKNFLKG